MKKLLFNSLNVLTVFLSVGIHAQTTGTFIVTDKTNRMSSCQDSSISLVDVYRETGIRDLNDAADDVSKYRILKLNGSVITDEVLTSVKYSDYPIIYVEKANTPFTGHNGVVVYLNLIQRPTGLFLKDTLKYTVDKGATANFSKDFFTNFEYWDSGKDITKFEDRVILVNEQTHEEKLLSAGPFFTVGKGHYKVKVNTAICTSEDLMWDSIAVVVDESPCSSLEIKDLPSVCRDQIVDLSDYIKIDGVSASSSQLSQITVWDKSYAFSQNRGAVLDLHALDMSQMINAEDRSPYIEMAYAPNVALGVCPSYLYRFSTKIPTRFINTGVVFFRDNAGMLKMYQIDGEYYGFNGTLKKEMFSNLFLSPYQGFAGTEFTFYSGSQHSNPVTSSVLSEGAYTIVAKHQNCTSDSSVFSVNVKKRDFDIIWQSASNLGKGYYTFTAPEYANANYSWIAWSGSIVSGLGTREIIVYFSDELSPATTVQCTITLDGARLANAAGALTSAVYLNVKESKSLEEVVTETNADSKEAALIEVYPNPSAGTFVISGEGTYILKMFNAMGQEVYSDANYASHTAIQLRTTGMHMVQLQQGDKKYLLKVVMQ